VLGRALRLQKPLQYRGGQKNSCSRQNGKFGELRGACVAPSQVSRFLVAEEFRRTDPEHMWSLSRSAAWRLAQGQRALWLQACRKTAGPLKAHAEVLSRRCRRCNNGRIIIQCRRETTANDSKSPKVLR
jgi:hypothetical protein